MKLVMTLLVRNEEDILRENLDFHLASGVDEVILMDNLSTDATAEIAHEYERGGNVHYVHQPKDNHDQGAWVTELARQASRDLKADWVINCDADEFWWPHVGTLKDALGSLPDNVIVASAQRTNFVARVDDGRPFWRRMDVRWLASVNPLGRPLLGKVAHRALPDVVVSPGNHLVSAPGGVGTPFSAPITVLHFPIRTREQFFNKVVQMGAAFERNTELDHSVGAAQRHLYRQYLDGELDRMYDRELLSDEQIRDGLDSHVLVRDDRLIRALEAIRHPSPGLPERHGRVSDPTSPVDGQE